MLWKHIGVTLAETVAGFVLGTILGTLTAILLWWNRMISDVAEPYLVVLNALPKTAPVSYTHLQGQKPQWDS